MEMTDDLLIRYRALWQRFGVDDPALPAAGQRVIDAYHAPTRHYHDGAHLRDVLTKLDWARDAVQDTTPEDRAQMFDIIELALWYHDVVYDATAKDNEAQSRDMMWTDARRFGLSDDIARTAADLIDLTAHHAQARTLPEKIMTDCDLAILGAHTAAFQKYDAGIRAEYAHVPAPLYQTVRRQVLKGFLDQPQIFKTEAFRTAFEAQARQNLRSATQSRRLGWLRRLLP